MSIEPPPVRRSSMRLVASGMFRRGKRAVPEPITVGDRYTVERELGRGGMAVVYLARDRKHDRPVAIKILRPEIVGGRGRPALPARDPDPRAAPAPQHPPPARFRHHRRGAAPAVLRHAVRGGRDPAPAAHPRGPAPGGGGAPPGAGDRRSAPLRPWAGTDPSRREARERAALAGPRPGGRLRHRARRRRRGRATSS